MNRPTRNAVFFAGLLLSLMGSSALAQTRITNEFDSTIKMELPDSEEERWISGDFTLRRIFDPFRGLTHVSVQHGRWGKVTLVRQTVGPGGVQLVLKKGGKEWTESYAHLRWDLFSYASQTPDRDLKNDGYYPLYLQFAGAPLERVVRDQEGKEERDSTSRLAIYFSPSALPEGKRTAIVSELETWVRTSNESTDLTNEEVEHLFKKKTVPQVVVFWYQGCGPCLKPMARLWPYYRELKGKVQFSFISVMTKDTTLMTHWPRTRTRARDLLSSDSTYLHPDDFYFLEKGWDGSFLQSLSPDWDGSFVPMVFLIRNKKVEAVKSGDDLAAKMESVFSAELAAARRKR